VIIEVLLGGRKSVAGLELDRKILPGPPVRIRDPLLARAAPGT